MDQDQFNPYEAYEGYVVRVPHNPLDQISGPINVGRSLDFKTIRNEFPF
jgi:hypothetical protein